MKKVLIISYFFPPGNFAGSYRIKAWAEHLHKFGYYPIVVTRHWLENETDYTAISAEQEIKKEEYGHYSVYRLPYRGSFRDRLVKRFGPKAIPLGKVFSFFQVIGQNYLMRSIPYRNIFEFSRKLLKENPEIKLVLTSGRPFIHFKFAHLLKKEFPYIEWVADYRDPWNSYTYIKEDLKLRFFKFLELSKEKEYLSSASFFTTCSEGFVDNINEIIHKRGYVISNGFEDFIKFRKTPYHKKRQISINYIGTLYENQKIELFLYGLKRFFEEGPDSSLKIQFFGLSNQPIQVKRITNLLKGFETKLVIHPWLEKKQMLKKAIDSDYFLLCGIPEQKGRHTAKLFDYFSMKKPIILCPSDNDILEKEINRTKTGVVLKSSEEVFEWLRKMYKEWLNTGVVSYEGNEELLQEYTYENQVRKLAKLLDQL